MPRVWAMKYEPVFPEMITRKLRRCFKAAENARVKLDGITYNNSDVHPAVELMSTNNTLTKQERTQMIAFVVKMVSVVMGLPDDAVVSIRMDNAYKVPMIVCYDPQITDPQWHVDASAGAGRRHDTLPVLAFSYCIVSEKSRVWCSSAFDKSCITRRALMSIEANAVVFDGQQLHMGQVDDGGSRMIFTGHLTISNADSLVGVRRSVSTRKDQTSVPGTTLYVRGRGLEEVMLKYPI